MPDRIIIPLRTSELDLIIGHWHALHSDRVIGSFEYTEDEMAVRTCRLDGCERPIAPYRASPKTIPGKKMWKAQEEHIRALSARHRAKPRLCKQHMNANNGLRTKFGITIETYLEMYHGQEGLCLLCDRPGVGLGMNEGRQRGTYGYLCLDHCHKTGKLRGLICWNCNLGLGYFQDSAEVLRKAADYLELP